MGQPDFNLKDTPKFEQTWRTHIGQRETSRQNTEF